MGLFSKKLRNRMIKMENTDIFRYIGILLSTLFFVEISIILFIPSKHGYLWLCYVGLMGSIMVTAFFTKKDTNYAM